MEEPNATIVRMSLFEALSPKRSKLEEIIRTRDKWLLDERSHGTAYDESFRLRLACIC